MNFTEAINRAKAGEESGFGYLYENTYRSKYYLALQYMKNEDAAQDVLQDAYIRAFSKLDTLADPEAFPAWLGIIVANTAKNMLKKKNPLLFSEVDDPETADMEYQIEDEREESQPEMAYTKQETKELVRQLIDSLSEEQRLCILMYHIEGIPIKQIASTLGCSENTVKSRLNYGRKNLKAKAEELQKKGYKLYSGAPIGLLLWLLRSQESSMAADGSIGAAGKAMADRIFSNPGIHPAGHVAAAGAAKTGLLHTVAGKAIAAVLGVGIVGGAAAAAINGFGGGGQAESVLTTQAVVQETDVQTETAAETEMETENVLRSLEAGDYPNLIAGNLTKEELTLVLAYGPEEIPEGGFSDSDYLTYMNSMCQASDREGQYIEYYGTDAQYRSRYSLEDINRLFSSFTDFQFSEENDSDTEYGINVENSELLYTPATMSYTVTVSIVNAQYTDTEMDIYYSFERTSADPMGSNYSLNKKAVLKPTENGMFRIVQIQEVTDMPESAPEENAQPDGSEMGKDPSELYADALTAVANKEDGFTFPREDVLDGNYGYFVADLNRDGIPELVVGGEYAETTFYYRDLQIFTCEQTDSGYTLKKIQGEQSAMNLFLAADGNGLFVEEFSRGTGDIWLHRLTIEESGLVYHSTAEYTYTLGDDGMNRFSEDNPEVTWVDIDDRSGLSVLE